MTISVDKAIEVVEFLKDMTIESNSRSVLMLKEIIGDGAVAEIRKLIMRQRKEIEKTKWDKQKDKVPGKRKKDKWSGSLHDFLKFWWVGNELHIGYTEEDKHPITEKEMSGVARHMHLGSKYVKPRPFLGTPESRRMVIETAIEMIVLKVKNMVEGNRWI